VVRGRAGGDANVVSEIIETGGNRTPAFALIESVLREAKLERGQIDVLAVGLGPGSYTGIRIALALAQGWQLASPGRGLKLIGISSAECLAAQAHADAIRGQVNVVVDAQRSEFYLATYEITETAFEEVEPLQIRTLEELELRADGRNIFIGPEVTRWFPDGRLVYPRAAKLGQLALGRNEFTAADKLEPIYLRETSFVKAPLGKRSYH